MKDLITKLYFSYFIGKYFWDIAVNGGKESQEIFGHLTFREQGKAEAFRTCKGRARYLALDVIRQYRNWDFQLNWRGKK